MVWILIDNEGIHFKRVFVVDDNLVERIKNKEVNFIIEILKVQLFRNLINDFAWENNLLLNRKRGIVIQIVENICDYIKVQEIFKKDLTLVVYTHKGIFIKSKINCLGGELEKIKEVVKDIF